MLFDHFVGAAKYRGREREAEGLGGLEIYHCLVFCWCLYREVGRFFTLENAVNVTGRAAMRIDRIRSIRNQAADGDVEACGIDSRKFVPSRERNDQIAMNDRNSASRHDHAA